MALLIFGCMSVFAASYREVDTGSLGQLFSLSTSFGKQMMWVSVCIVLSTLILLLDSKIFTAFAYISYVVACTLLVCVLFVGATIHGNKGWFAVGGFGIQPAEFAKFATALTLGKYISTLNIDIRQPRSQLTAFAIIGFPALLVLAQGDLGSTLVFCSFMLVLFREGINPLYLIIPTIIGIFSVITLKFGFLVSSVISVAIAGVVIWRVRRKTTQFLAITITILLVANAYFLSVNYVFHKTLKGYQRARIAYTLGIEQDKKKEDLATLAKEAEEIRHGGKKHKKFDDWNVRQSIIAIGSGGLLGKGFLNGTQTKFDFVPEQTTDFIFCTIGEEEGFWGTTLILILYVSLLWRLVWMADRQRSKFSRIYGFSVASILFFHFMINVGMTIGVVPVIGIPLPFISYGGSSLLTFTMMLMIMVKLDADRLHVLR
jgi:rod shape determining protein RodA